MPSPHMGAYSSSGGDDQVSNTTTYYAIIYVIRGAAATVCLTPGRFADPRSIYDRPEIVAPRSRIEDWEADAVLRARISQQ
ncbi:hypothetical protein [Novilysobacter avium]|uniref:Uncharacterized protein n=1 Tax=Novilysobacter avium TaxID=2781023 RepID=A0A7S6UJZ6_9GAMM|nr:hypothetical protein [Lysobacter avium]QOW21673.1 hypothetical protein INQ42_10610 [Lysobacter avium]